MKLAKILLVCAVSTFVLAKGRPALAADEPAADSDDEADTAAPAASAGKDEAPKGPKLVVVADARQTATENSHLRASLYDVARDAGYEAAGKLDVEGAASRASLMRAGVVTADEAELPALRRALDVATLVRVSKSAAGGVRLSVCTKRGVQTRDLSAADAAEEEVIAATLKGFLPPVYRAAKTETAGPLLPNGAIGSLTSAAKPDSTPPPHEAWEARGGFRPTFGAMLNASALFLTHVSFKDRAGVEHTARETGVGGGPGVRVGMMYMPIPDPSLGVGSFVTVRFGLGLDTAVLYARKPSGYDLGGQITYQNQALWVSSAPLYLGFGIAAGKFPNATTWRGVVIGFGYAPAAQFQMDLKNTSGKFRVNPAGIDASVDITRLHAEPSDPEMQIRIAASGLLPMGDDRPGFVSLGIGAIWY